MMVTPVDLGAWLSASSFRFAGDRVLFILRMSVDQCLANVVHLLLSSS